MSDGWVGAIQAVLKWDKTKEAKVNLSTFAYRRIYGAMIDGLRERTLWHRGKKMARRQEIPVGDMGILPNTTPDPARIVEEEDWIKSELALIKNSKVKKVLLDVIGGERQDIALKKAGLL